MKKLGLILVVGLIAMGCSKDQQVVKRLAAGDWKITDVSVNGVSEDPSEYDSFVYTFEKCKVSKEDCEGEYKYNDPDKGEQTQSFTYSISEKGTKITVKVNFFGIASSVTSDIIENSKDKFIWSTTDEDGDVTETTIEKI